MNSFISIPVDESITFHIPNTWVKEVGDLGEYAFISGDGAVFMTLTFIRFGESDTTPLQQILEQATAPVKEIADFTSPLIQTEKHVAQHIEMGGQSMLFAMTDGIFDNNRIIAMLFFKTEDPDIFEKNRTLMEQIMEGVKIKA